MVEIFCGDLVSMILSYSMFVRLPCPLVGLFRIYPSRGADVFGRFSLDNPELLNLLETYSGCYFIF